MAGLDELFSPLRCYASLERPQPATTGPAAGYSDPSTWESRYEEQEGTFDWYNGYAELRFVFEEFCPPCPESEVLMLGCGNSELSGEMHQAGFRRIMNIDISASAVKKMEEQFAPLDLEWRVMDATAMSFKDCSYNLALDKGTLDAMMHGGSVGEGLAMAMTVEVWRTLRPGGLFMLISHSPHRLPVLDGAVADKHGSSAHWEVLDLRKCALSPQAMLINILRSKLKGRSLREGFRDPALLLEATQETKLALKQMQFLEAFRLFKAKKAQQQREKAGGEASRPEARQRPIAEAEEDNEDGAPRDRRQPFCWVYILRKPL